MHFFGWCFWVGFWEKWAFSVVFSWIERGEIVVRTWCFDGHKVALKTCQLFELYFLRVGRSS
jgi:hypothetical protein